MLSKTKHLLRFFTALRSVQNDKKYHTETIPSQSYKRKNTKILHVAQNDNTLVTLSNSKGSPEILHTLSGHNSRRKKTRTQGI